MARIPRIDPVDLVGGARSKRMSSDAVVDAAEKSKWAAKAAEWARRLDAGEYPMDIARKENIPAWQIREAVARHKNRQG